uniref:3'(2'),5'-bisphosphate nucleotidase 1 n=1 Tax=Tetraselmis chuii TaxID=63592 RepID=A0A7S1SR38_9CHLO
MLACEAGIVIREMLDDAGGRMAASTDKGDFGFGEADPQTLADLAAEKCIINGLARAFPGLTVVGEEGLATSDSGAEDVVDEGSGPTTLKFIPTLFEDGMVPADLLDTSIQLEDVCVWVDPLDGTQEFVDGNFERVTVLIGITVRGKPVAGAILQPFVQSGSAAGGKGRLLWGGLGLGVWDGGADGIAGATRVRNDPCEGRPVVATSRSHPSPVVAEAAAALKPQQILQLGGAGSKVVMIIEGKLSHWVYPRKGTKRWDTAAPEALLRAVGGFCVDSDGRPYDYSSDCQPRNDEGVIAGSGHVAWEQCVNAYGWQTPLPL